MVSSRSQQRSYQSYRSPDVIDDPSNGDVVRSLILLSFFFLLVVLSLRDYDIKKNKTYRKLKRFFGEIYLSVLKPLGLLPKEEPKKKKKKKGKQSQHSYHINFKNFQMSTRGHFVPCEIPNRRPDSKSMKSWYWDVGDEYVVRYSDDWSNTGQKVGTNWWTYDGTEYDNIKSQKPSAWLCGKVHYADMVKVFDFAISFRNFYLYTRAHYVPCDYPKRPPDYKSHSGSEYWDVGGEYVIRSSDHWSNHCGFIANCWWTFEDSDFLPKTVLTGMCRYSDFEKTFFRGSWHLNDRKLRQSVNLPKDLRQERTRRFWYR